MLINAAVNESGDTGVITDNTVCHCCVVIEICANADTMICAG